MKFKDLPCGVYFAVLKPQEPVPLLRKDGQGIIRRPDYAIESSEIEAETEVQPILYDQAVQGVFS